MTLKLGKDYIVLVMCENGAGGIDLTGNSAVASATAKGIGEDSGFSGIGKLVAITTPATDTNRFPNLEAVDYENDFEEEEKQIDGVPQHIPIRKTGSVSITFTAEGLEMDALFEKARFGVNGPAETLVLFDGMDKYDASTLGFRVVVIHKSGTHGTVFYHCTIPKGGLKINTTNDKAVVGTLKFNTNMWEGNIPVASLGTAKSYSV